MGKDNERFINVPGLPHPYLVKDINLKKIFFSRTKIPMIFQLGMQQRLLKFYTMTLV